MSNGSSVTLVFPARAEYLLLARLALTGLARLAPADEEAVADLRLAVTEAAANVCRHAYPDGDGNVRVELRLTPDDRVEVTVEDDGPGFDEHAVSDWQPDALADRGMGLAIIRAVADDVELSRGDGRGARLRFTRSLR